MSDKPEIVKPGLYTMFYEQLKQIARQYGYNLLLNGSMNRDLDLVAVPWIDNPQDEFKMIQDFEEYLTGKKSERKEHYLHKILPGGRKSYVIQLNRGNKHGEWVRFEDKEYYIDISITPLPEKKDPLNYTKEEIEEIESALREGSLQIEKNIKEWYQRQIKFFEEHKNDVFGETKIIKG